MDEVGTVGDGLRPAAATPSVTTVLGPIAPADLGTVNYHEHLFQVSPLLVGDELDDPARSAVEAASLAASGFAAMVDATPIGLGRRPADLAAISATTGLTVVAATGFHRGAHYPADASPGAGIRTLSVDERAALFVRDLTVGMPIADGDDGRGSGGMASGPADASVRAGLIKTGIGYWEIGPFERATLEAAAIAHAATGAPLMVHLEFCTAAHEVLDLLASLGVPAASVALAHADRDPDPGLHLDLMARGAWLGYDGFARPRTRSDAELLDLTERVVAGGGTRVLIGGDVARATRYLGYGGMPGLEYLGRRYLPRLVDRVGADVVRTFTIANPAAWLAH